MTRVITAVRPPHVQVVVQPVDHVDGVSEPSAVDAEGPGGTVDRVVDGVDEQFLALVCSDPEWLRAEFDAIIAAAWSSPPPAGPGSCRAATQPEKPVGSSGPAPPEPVSGPRSRGPDPVTPEHPTTPTRALMREEDVAFTTTP